MVASIRCDPCTGCEQYDPNTGECKATLHYLEHYCVINAFDKQIERFEKELDKHGKRYPYI